MIGIFNWDEFGVVVVIFDVNIESELMFVVGFVLIGGTFYVELIGNDWVVEIDVVVMVGFLGVGMVEGMLNCMDVGLFGCMAVVVMGLTDVLNFGFVILFNVKGEVCVDSVI